MENKDEKNEKKKNLKHERCKKRKGEGKSKAYSQSNLRLGQEKT
jgi:hypothetical protein